MLAHFTKENINAVNIKCLFSFSLARPGSNAPIEHVFSVINALWSDEKNRLQTETVKILTIGKTQFKDLSRSEFLPKYRKKRGFWNKFIHLINIQVNLGGLSQSKTYILFLYEFF
jgi:hypothetical protein